MLNDSSVAGASSCHVRNRLSAQSTRVLLCLGLWSELGLVESEDVICVSGKLPDVIGEEEAMDEG